MFIIQQQTYFLKPLLQTPASNIDLAAGLQAFITIAGGTRLIDQLSGLPPYSNNSTIRRGAQGELVNAYNGAAGSIFDYRAGYALTGPMTIAVIFDLDALTNYNCLASCSATPSTSGWELRVGSGPTDSRILVTRAGANFNQWAASGSDLLSAGSKNNFVAVTFFDGHTASSNPPPLFNVNGTILSGSLVSAQVDGPTSDPNSPLYIGNRSDSVTPLSGAISSVILFGRGLNSVELERVRLQPYSLLQAYEELTTFGSSGTPVRAYYRNGVRVTKVSTGLVGTGLKPIVRVNTGIKERATSEGVGQVLDASTANLRDLAAGETLEI